jgi:hypothetical protein
MAWPGTMNCVVTNQTGGTITNLSVLHQWEGYMDQPTPDVTPSLAQNESVSFQVHVGPGGSDDWTLSFVDSKGKNYYRNDKQCDVEEEDVQSGNPIYINLLPPAQGFSIEMPSSSSCNDNSYSS